MATSPIYSWPEPDNTDLVKNGALAIRTLGDAIDTTMGTMVAKTIIDAKGDLIAASAADTPARLAVGTDGQTLVADSSTATGLKWATASSGATLVGCSLSKTNDPSIPDSTWTTINYNAENYDTDGFHSLTTNTERITIPTGKGGKYQIFVNIIFANSATGDRQVRLMKNGSDLLRVYGPKPNGTTTYTLYTVESLVATDYIEIQVIQSSGGALTAYFNGFYNYFGVNYIGA